MTWAVDKHTTIDKSFYIRDSASELLLKVDYDDVNHDEVDSRVAEVIEVLNRELPDRHFELELVKFCASNLTCRRCDNGHPNHYGECDWKIARRVLEEAGR